MGNSARQVLGPSKSRAKRKGGAAFREEPRRPLACFTRTQGEAGCYIEVLETLKPETCIEVVLWLDTEKVCAQAKVVTNDPHIGNGLKFVGMGATEAEKLRRFLPAAAQQKGQRMPLTATPSIFEVTIAAAYRSTRL
jgi:hypothetical protein